MATMNVSLPDAMKAWVESRAESGKYSNSSDYVRDLIRRDREREEAIAELQEIAARSLASGISSRSREEIWAFVRSRAVSDNGV